MLIFSNNKMRTKSMERKRYSLRTSKSKDVLTSITKDTKKHISCNKSSQKKEESSGRHNITGSVKRKKGKPVRTLQDEFKTDKRKTFTKGDKSLQNSEPDFSLDIIGLANNDEIKTTTYSKETTTSDQDNEDTPVHVALQHAIACHLASSCSYPKCLIAKQFIMHCATCSKGSEDCTICKAMDIMVCKHAQICSVPLEKCCAVPSCDKVRLMVLEEWVKLKHKHNEMMQRVFRGLIHAKKCRGKKCDLLLCKNIKSVLLHTHQCGRADKCKTKRFIIQLCEHHQQMCCNKNCEVEFCQEIARKKKEDEIHRMFLINKKEKQLEQESTVRNLQSEESGQRNISIIPSMQSSSFITGLQPNFAPWPPGFGPLPGGQFFFPNVPLPCPYGMENQINQICTESDNSQMAQPAHYSFPQLQGNSVGDRTKIYNSEMSDEISQLPPSQPDDLYTELEPERSAKVEESSISPTEEMYYQLLREKERGTKSVLPSLSPNDLQTILMARGEGAQILSPVTDNRANYSEVLSFSQQDNSPHSSQESELEENPIPTNNYESTKPLSNTFLPSKNVDSIYNQQQLQARHEGSDRFKTEAEWSKIDFVKQQMLQEELDVETETADETDSDGISKPDYYDDEFSQSIPAHKHIEQSTITSIERNFLNIIKGQKLK